MTAGLGQPFANDDVPGHAVEHRLCRRLLVADLHLYIRLHGVEAVDVGGHFRPVCDELYGRLEPEPAPGEERAEKHRAR